MIKVNRFLTAPRHLHAVRYSYGANKRREAVVARDAQARGLVGTWERLLEGYNAALPGIGTDPRLGGTREQLIGFGRGLREHPDAVQALRERGAEFGMERRPNLARVLADVQPERVITGIMETAEAGMRADLREQARAAEQEAARRRELEARQRPSQGMGMSMG